MLNLQRLFHGLESTLFNEKENIDFLINKIFPQYISITLLINEIYNSFRTMDTSD